MKWKIAVCILFFAQMLALASSERHRHRHRHRYYQQRNVNDVDLLNADQSYAEQILLGNHIGSIATAVDLTDCLHFLTFRIRGGSKYA